jgi:hypothetical protein
MRVWRYVPGFAKSIHISIYTVVAGVEYAFSILCDIYKTNYTSILSVGEAGGEAMGEKGLVWLSSYT